MRILFCAQALWRSARKQIAYILLCAPVLVSCTPQTYGLVLWAENNSALQNGDTVEVTRQIDAHTLEVSTQDGTRVQVQPWQLEHFDSQEEVAQFAITYTPYKNTFARCEKKALPVRESANRFSDTQYRLDEEEIVKVLGQSETRVSEGGLEDYWYHVLTRSGTRGWVFGYHLTIIDTAQNKVVSKQEARDNLALFLNAIWRPDYFTKMQERGAYDLERFDRIFGLFPSPLENTIQIRLPDYYFEVIYNTPVLHDANRFSFGNQQQLSITLIDNGTAMAEVHEGGTTQQFIFHTFSDNVQQIVNRVRAEQEAAALSY